MRCVISKVRVFNFAFVFTLLLGAVACGNPEVGQYTNDLQTTPFISKLYGKSTKTIAIQSDAGSHIAWMGLDYSADYKYFRMDRILVNGREETLQAATSSTVKENISVGVPNTNGPAQILVTLTYSPSRAVPAADEPHTAFLLIAYDRPEVGIVRVALSGLTQGISDNKCIAAAQSGKKFTYSLIGDAVDLYLCDDNAVVGQGTDGSVLANDPLRPNTNFKRVPISEDLVFYQPPGDENTVCFVSGNSSDGVAATIPDFALPVPPVQGLPTDLTELDVNMQEGTFVSCPVTTDEDGNKVLLCDKSVPLEVLGGVLPLAPLTVTNASILPKSDDCPNFATPPVGSGNIGDEDVTLVAWGAIGFSQIIAPYNVDGALVVTTIKMKLKEE